MRLPSLYPILDFSCFAGRQDPLAAMVSYAEELLAADASIIQYRDKTSGPQTFLRHARELRRVTQGRATFIVNDRLDIALACDADGIHLGQDDLSPVAARKIFDQIKDGKAKIIGFSTHNLVQVREADSFPVDYIAIGPVFATASKANPDPVIGLDGVRQARAATTKPLVAIGGITRENCLQVKAAGADSVAVISDLLESPAKAVAAFLRVLG
ncbi:MAG: thiamine phosphate synthase [Acidobacteriia bacterium]|nr:thiamine phosphate synthase [Terriglobia bacterium]